MNKAAFKMSGMRTLLFSSVLIACCTLSLRAQQAMVLPQQSLDRWDIGTANFSGITPLGGNRYAVVSDKEPEDGFFIFRIDQNRFTGEITSVYVEGFFGTSPERRDGTGASARDTEGVAFQPSTHTVWISGEGDQAILGYNLNGHPTGGRLDVPSELGRSAIYTNCGFEALCYDTITHRFWVTTETTVPADGQKPGPQLPRGQNLLRLQSFDDEGRPLAQYLYRSEPGTVERFGRAYIFGVPALAALPDGRLLVMEREGHFAKDYLGSFVAVRLFAVDPAAGQPLPAGAPLTGAPALPKTLVAEWTTRLNLVRRDLANYEGMCLGAQLADGRPTLLCINDSQAGKGNPFVRLRDFLRVVVLPTF